MLKIFSETDTEIDAIVPFHLKDIFKAKFKSARWNAGIKTWSIPKNQKRKFEKFIDFVNKNGVLETVKKLELEEFSENEVKNLEQTLNYFNSEFEKRIDELQSARSRRANLSEIDTLISERKHKIEEISNEIAKIENENTLAQTQILSSLDGIFNINEIIKQKKELERWHSEKTSVAHSKFDAAQVIINEIRNQLREAGFDSRALKALAIANFNRPDRDSTNHITKDMILTFENAA